MFRIKWLAPVGLDSLRQGSSQALDGVKNAFRPVRAVIYAILARIDLLQTAPAASESDTVRNTLRYGGLCHKPRIHDCNDQSGEPFCFAYNGRGANFNPRLPAPT